MPLADILWWLPFDLSEHGWQIDRLINWMHVVMALLFVGWGVFLAYCLTRFRYHRNPTALYDPIKAKSSKAIEVAVIVVEVILLVGFSMPVLARYKNVRPGPETHPFEVHVVAQQFEWRVHYAGADNKFGRRRIELVNDETNPIGLDREGDPNAKDDIVIRNELRLPVGRDVIISLTSKDVIHSFSIPMLRVKQDVIPGMDIPVWFKVKEGETSDAVRDRMKRMVGVPAESESTAAFEFWCRNAIAMADVKRADGSVVLKQGKEPSANDLAALRASGIAQIEVAPRNPVEIQCAQLCGNSHFKMRGQVILLTPAEFEKWFAEQTAGGEEFIDE